MGYASAKTVAPDTIPVVDITALRHGEDVQSVAQALHRASQGLGFIYVRGHGIDDRTIELARTAAYDFFRSQESLKQQLLISAQHRGWLKPGQAKMDDDAKVDLKESFIWGYQDHNGACLQDHPLRGENQWPEFVPQLQACSMAYFRAADEVARHLLRGFATGLDLQEDFFLQKASTPLSRASYVYYPVQPEDCGEQQFGVGPHTDFGVLTVLCQDDTGGLQVQDINGDWIHAPPIEGTLIVNVGDLLSRWTAGEYKSTPHRVVNTSGRERLSLVLAFDPDPDTVIDASSIPGLTSKEPPTTCGDYLLWRFAKAFSYRQKAQ
ncbi:MAG: 2OG-Fe(II) oxygenase family protein [Pseudomonadota bacterium]